MTNNNKDKNVKQEVTPSEKNKSTNNTNEIPEKFRNPKKLGFLRFVMIMFGFVPFMGILGCFFTSKEQFVLNGRTFKMIIDCIVFSVIFWMIWKRKKDTKKVVLAAMSFDYIVSVTLSMQNGLWESIIADFITNGLVVLYFWKSKRVKYCLTEPFIIDPESKEFKTNVDFFKPKTWVFWRDLAIIFCVFSVVGHWMEAAYCYPVKMGWLPGLYDPNSQIWSDWLFPFPIYGFGAVACVLLFYPIKNKLQKIIKTPFVSVLLVFLISTIVCSALELAMGLMTNLDYSLWDYRTMWCNFMGQVCLQNSLGFGLAATIMTYVVYPIVKGGIAKLPRDGANILFICVVVSFAGLMIFYYINNFASIALDLFRFEY